MSDNHRHPIDEMDLLAYADGRLERDPARQAAVEEYLRDHPDEAARIENYVQQNNAIRAAYAGVAKDPVPERLLEVLEREPRRPTAKLAMQATAAVVALAVAASAGWFVGRSDPVHPDFAGSFVEQAMSAHPGTAPAQGPARPAASGNQPQPLVTLAQRISLELQPPDLSNFGFRQVDVRPVPGNGAAAAVRVTYADAANRTISLFLKTRWEEEPPTLRMVEEDGVSVAYWLDGPLVYGLAAQLEQGMLSEIASHIRKASRTKGAMLEQAPTNPPVIQPPGSQPATTGLEPEGNAPGGLAVPPAMQGEGEFGNVPANEQ